MASSIRKCRRCGAQLLPRGAKKTGLAWRHAHEARGLCGPCYRNPAARSKFDTVNRARADFLADYLMLRSNGWNNVWCAKLMKMSYSGLNTAINRARKAGQLEQSGKPKYEDIRLVTNYVKVRAKRALASNEDSLSARAILSNFPEVAAAVRAYRVAQQKMNEAINTAISAEIEAGNIVENEDYYS